MRMAISFAVGCLAVMVVTEQGNRQQATGNRSHGSPVARCPLPVAAFASTGRSPSACRTTQDECGPQPSPSAVGPAPLGTSNSNREPRTANLETHGSQSVGVRLCGSRLDVLLAAIRQVESGGDDRAVGDGGRALGPLQIHRALWEDACRLGGVRWPWETEAFDWQKSCQVARWYWAGLRCRSDEERGRSWNGGPRGPKNPATLGYWGKVRANLDGQCPR
jgi:hypothetical protein